MATRKVHNEQLGFLYTFVLALKKEPTLLNNPELSFFRDYLVRNLKAKVPPNEDSGRKGEADHNDTEWKLPPLPPNPYEEELEEEDGEVESDVEYENMETVVEDKDEALPEFRDSGSEVTDEMRCQVEEKKLEAAVAMTSGQFDDTVRILTEAIMLDPNSAELFVQRACVYLQQGKPKKAIHDCNRALDLEADSAAGFKCRGRAHKMLGKWEEAFNDLTASSQLQFDEETDAFLKAVTPNAKKQIAHNKKYERLLLKRKKRVWWELLKMLFLFVASCSMRPSLLHNSELKFYKDWLEQSLSAKIPAQTEILDEDICEIDPISDTGVASGWSQGSGPVEEKSHGASKGASEEDKKFEDLVEHFVQQGFERDDVEVAVKASRCNKHLALEYLTEGVPLDATLDFLKVEDDELTNLLEAGVGMSGRSAGKSKGASDEDSLLSSMKNHQAMQKLFQAIQGDTNDLESLLEGMGEENPEVLQAIGQDSDQFLSMFGEHMEERGLGEVWNREDSRTVNSTSVGRGTRREGAQARTGPSTSGRQAGGSGPTQRGASSGATGGSQSGGAQRTPRSSTSKLVVVTREEKAEIDKLMELGVSEEQAVQAYFACEKNLQLAAIVLLSMQ